MTTTHSPNPSVATSLPFIRSELASLQAYTPHPGGTEGQSVAISIDRVDTNENPYDLPLEIKQKLAQHWVEAIESNRYPDGGHQRLKAAIAEYVVESAGMNVGAASPLAIRNEHRLLPSQISVGNGSDELLRSILIATCIGGEGSILVAAPTFSMYGILAKTLGIPVVSIARNADFEVDVAAAQTAIRDRQAAPIRVVFMVHPNSPTGNALSATELDWMRSLPADILVVIDEAYFEFSQQTVVAELAEHPNWIVLRTFSKAFRLAAHRVGYAVGHPQLIATLEQVRLPYNLPSMSLAAAELVLQHRLSLLSVLPELTNERDRLFVALSKFDALKVWRSDANFLYVRMLEIENPELAMAQLVTQLKIQGTSIRHTGGGLRISIGSPAENDRTIIRIGDLLRAF
ncbi:histidinol-phosphate transaminase [Chamaesiphon minutus]|uniref:Histidinol-phosphate aminotransferase n=1 Tax=Chamaesiphon minutus (strain ATCC 27169 / PCC 6605) TaxID=1173020 RepID=K9UIN3_CHAP6|nr:histidinol-phosphate transaminase [Chamaesiphon minutus]AFY94972.1 PLP-dependent enzyme, histidinol-phosphate/aromatic aminotransferase or cobyric acid decarboxylase [Chamaesiphon minutus PCC 6605]